jgi:uncharacterized membrane protein
MGKVNRLAVFALFCCFTVPVLGIVFGILALNEIEDEGGKERGSGVARSAIVLGVIGLIVAVIAAVLVVSAIRHS